MTNEKIKSLPELERLTSKLKNSGKRIVFTNGCFDLLHLGHIKLLAEAKKKGDVLVVGLNSDRSIKGLKGPSRPILCQDDRAQILAALECVDYVVVFDEPNPLNLIECIRPDVLIKGGDWELDEVVGGNLVSSYGGEVISGPLEKGRSTQSIIETVLERFK